MPACKYGLRKNSMPKRAKDAREFTVTRNAAWRTSYGYIPGPVLDMWAAPDAYRLPSETV